MKITRRSKVIIALGLAAVTIAAAITWRVTRTPFGQGRAELVYSEKALGAMDPGYEDDTLSTSQDMTHVAYIAQHGGKYVVVRDGVAGAAYDDTEVDHYRSWPVMTLDGRHVAYEAKRGAEWFMVVDGKESGPFNLIHSLGCSFNGTRIAYCARRDGKWTLIIQSFDGDTHYSAQMTSCVEYEGSDFEWNPRTDRFACDIERTGQHWLWVDGKEYGPYSGKISPSWSPGGTRHLASVDTPGQGQRLVIDGTEIAGAVGGEEPAWSDDDMRCAYVVQRGNKQCCVVDGVEGKAYDEVKDVTVSTDGRHYAYAACTTQPAAAVVVIDGKEGPPYVAVELPCLGRDGHLVYAACKGKKWFVVADGAECKEYDEIWNLRLAPDGVTPSYDAKLSGTRFNVLGTHDGPFQADCHCGASQWADWAIMASPDRKHMAYTTDLVSSIARLQGRVNSWLGREVLTFDIHDRSCVILDRSRGPECDYATQVLFTADSRHAAYVAERDDQVFLVLDGRKNRLMDADDILDARILNDCLRMLLTRKGQLILADVRLKSLP